MWPPAPWSTCAPSRTVPAPPDPVPLPMTRIVIATGGTAGHVVPALAVADALRAEGAGVTFIGGDRAEATLVPEAGYELRRIVVEGVSRSNPLKAARAAGKAAGAVVTAPRPTAASAAVANTTSPSTTAVSTAGGTSRP